jgi:hypothetical protein
MLEESRLSELVASMRERWGALYGGQWRHVGAESIDLPD